MSSKRPRVMPTFPVAPYEKYQQPAALYKPVFGLTSGDDRLYTLTLSNKIAAGGSGVANDIVCAWDLSQAPQPRDGKVHKAQISVSQLHIYQATSNLFTANTAYLCCLDIPAPQSFSATNAYTTTPGAGMPDTLQRPNAFYKIFNASNSKYFSLPEPAASVTDFVGVYPVPRIEFSLRADDWPSRPIQSADNEDVRVALHLNIVLLD